MRTEKLVPLIICHRDAEGKTVDVEIISPGYVAVYDDDGKPTPARLGRER